MGFINVAVVESRSGCEAVVVVGKGGVINSGCGREGFLRGAVAEQR